MTLTIGGRAISSVYIVDDEPTARTAYGYSVEELNLRPIPADGPLTDIDQFSESMWNTAQAVICDFMLNARNYAVFNGAQLVAKQYQRQFPAVLCTRWEIAEFPEIRKYRRYIPVLLRPDELDPDSLVHALERCIEEFHGQFQPSRRSWRTLVRIEYVDQERGYVGVIIPGWDPQQGINLLLRDLPVEVQNRIANQKRFHAWVNIGGEANEDLYVEEWELD